MVALYPRGAADTAVHDAAMQRWGLVRGLPIPRLLAAEAEIVVSEDLGDENLEQAATARCAEDVGKALSEALAAFQRCPWEHCPNPPFDAAFFRRELAVFESFASLEIGCDARRFLDDLAERVAGHPFRLVHRDFHVHNLLWTPAGIRAVDFQDMRGGPDTYDAVSLLRERGGSDLLEPRIPAAVFAAACGWALGWETRLAECAAQRGLKVIGTFLRLAAQGRPGYLRWLPEVRRRTAEALEELGAPAGLIETAARPATNGGV